MIQTRAAYREEKGRPWVGPVKILPVPSRSKSHAGFFLRANTVGLRKGEGSGLILDDDSTF